MLRAEFPYFSAKNSVRTLLLTIRLMAPPGVDNDHPLRSVRAAVLERSASVGAEPCLLRAALVGALPAANVDHPLFGVTGAELASRAALQGVRRTDVAPGLGTGPFAEELDHALLGVSQAKIKFSRALDATLGGRGAAFVKAPLDAEVDHPLPGVLSAELRQIHGQGPEVPVLPAAWLGALPHSKLRSTVLGVQGAEHRSPPAVQVGHWVSQTARLQARAGAECSVLGVQQTKLCVSCNLRGCTCATLVGAPMLRVPGAGRGLPGAFDDSSRERVTAWLGALFVGDVFHPVLVV